jgi:hypothetical protein
MLERLDPIAWGSVILPGSSLIYDPNAGGDVEANLNFEADGLTVFGPTGRKLQHWPYSEIVHAFPKGSGSDAVLTHIGRPEVRLRVRAEGIYDAIQERAPQLRRRGFGWRWFWSTLGGMPNEAQVGLYLFAGVVIFTIYHFVTSWFE